MKAKDVRALGSEERNKKLSEVRLELLKEMGNVKMGRATKNPGKIRELKRTIARIETIKREVKK